MHVFSLFHLLVRLLKYLFDNNRHSYMFKKIHITKISYHLIIPPYMSEEFDKSRQLH